MPWSAERGPSSAETPSTPANSAELPTTGRSECQADPLQILTTASVCAAVKSHPPANHTRAACRNRMEQRCEFTATKMARSVTGGNVEYTPQMPVNASPIGGDVSHVHSRAGPQPPETPQRRHASQTLPRAQHAQGPVTATWSFTPGPSAWRSSLSVSRGPVILGLFRLFHPSARSGLSKNQGVQFPYPTNGPSGLVNLGLFLVFAGVFPLLRAPACPKTKASSFPIRQTARADS